MQNFLEFATEQKIPMTAEDVALEQEINTAFSIFLVSSPEARKQIAAELELLRRKRRRELVTSVDIHMLAKIRRESLWGRGGR